MFLGFERVKMYKRRDYVELYEKDQAKWALVRNVNTVMKHSTLLPVRRKCVCDAFYLIRLFYGFIVEPSETRTPDEDQSLVLTKPGRCLALTLVSFGVNFEFHELIKLWIGFVSRYTYGLLS